MLQRGWRLLALTDLPGLLLAVLGEAVLLGASLLLQLTNLLVDSIGNTF